MATSKQILGALGEILVTKNCACPRCKRKKTLKRLPINFKCADVICDFCGWLAQVKTASSTDIDKLPQRISGAAWKPQVERMKAGVYFPLFLVLSKTSRKKDCAIYYLPADFQKKEMFLQRKPLSAQAKRAGWQGFTYNIADLKTGFTRLF